MNSNKLANNLKESLNSQWDMQVKQKEMIEQVTHDIRTPITLMKGNLELLQEENPDMLSERLSDISNGMVRLEQYIEKLKRLSDTMEGKKEMVSDKVTTYWMEVVSSICRANGFHLKVVKKECSKICLDKEGIAVALQNIVTNSVEHSEKGSAISVEFSDGIGDFSIIIRDEGKGFEEELIPVLTEKFISGKIKDSNDKHGLGLWVVKKIVEANHGKLYLRNYCERQVGAEVKMVFRKE